VAIDIAHHGKIAVALALPELDTSRRNLHYWHRDRFQEPSYELGQMAPPVRRFRVASSVDAQPQKNRGFYVRYRPSTPTHAPTAPQAVYSSEAKDAKAMTIAIGFHCGDGNDLILAADRQITARGSYKVSRKKYSTNSEQFIESAFLYSGEPGAFASFTKKVEKSLKAIPDVTPEIVQDTIESTLDAMKLRDPYADPRFWLLAGVNDFWKPPRLIVFDGKEVFRAENGVSIIGCGDTSLINYLSEKLHRPDLAPNQGIALAAYLIKKATQYVDGCGEPIDVIHGDGLGYQVVRADKVSAGIQAIENQEDLLFTLLVQTPFQI
jgi:20S proteasome alpha/beta subunit